MLLRTRNIEVNCGYCGYEFLLLIRDENKRKVYKYGSAQESVTTRDLMGILIFENSGYTQQDERERLEQEFWDGPGTGSISSEIDEQPRLCVCGYGASVGTANWSVPAVVGGSTKSRRSTNERYGICRASNTARR
jgi:hypothetical protein